MAATGGSNNLEDINKLKEQLHWIDVEEREVNPSYFERFKKRMLRNPLVPIGCIATITVLGLGLRDMLRGHQRESQIKMRWRVGLQASTIAVFMGGLYLESYLQSKKKL